MKDSLNRILVKKDVKPLDDLLKVNCPASEPDDSVETVKLRGMLFARNGAFIGVKTGDMVMQIPINAVYKASEDPNGPGNPPAHGTYVILDVVKGTDIMLFRRMVSDDIEKLSPAPGKGSLPFVLSIPSQAPDYAVAVSKLASRDGKRAEFVEKLKPIEFTPITPLYDINKSTLASSAAGFRFTVTSPFDTKETKWFNKPFDTASIQNGIATAVTDHKVEEQVFDVTDSNSDVEEAQGDGLYSVASPFESKSVSVTSKSFDTLQPGGKITDFHDAYQTTSSTDSSSDVRSPKDNNA